MPQPNKKNAYPQGLLPDLSFSIYRLKNWAAPLTTAVSRTKFVEFK